MADDRGGPGAIMTLNDRYKRLVQSTGTQRLVLYRYKKSITDQLPYACTSVPVSTTGNYAPFPPIGGRGCTSQILQVLNLAPWGGQTP